VDVIRAACRGGREASLNTWQIINAETKVPVSVDALLEKIGSGIAHPSFAGFVPAPVLL